MKTEQSDANLLLEDKVQNMKMDVGRISHKLIDVMEAEHNNSALLVASVRFLQAVIHMNLNPGGRKRFEDGIAARIKYAADNPDTIVGLAMDLSKLSGMLAEIDLAMSITAEQLERGKIMFSAIFDRESVLEEIQKLKEAKANAN